MSPMVVFPVLPKEMKYGAIASNAGVIHVICNSLSCTWAIEEMWTIVGDTGIVHITCDCVSCTC